MNPDDVQAAREGLLLADLRGHPRWKFTGPDRVRYLNGQLTNDVRRLAPGGPSMPPSPTTR
ncbi:MAG: hypothetical protein HC909_04775, partial [Blastochloris sp.]|nr:hypothetical protein [Blastochloris sp.]